MMTNPFAVQLWSLKHAMTVDMEPTLAWLAAQGCRYVEAAGYNVAEKTVFNKSIVDFKEKLAAVNLKLISLHVELKQDNIRHVLEDANQLGVKYIIIPFIPDQYRKTPDDYYKIAEQLDSIGAKARAAGISLGYHNHQVEFDPAFLPCPMDILLQHTAPENVCFQPDIGWMIQAGADPSVYFNRYPHRFPLWHLRDVDQKGYPVAVGKGIVDFKSLLAWAGLAGMEYGIIETASNHPDAKKMMEESIRYVMRNL